MNELKECPFCGKAVVFRPMKIYHNGEKSPASIQCHNCNYHMHDYDDEELAKRWNTRPAEGSVEDTLTTIKIEDNFAVCQKCRTIVPPQILRYQMYYCPNCGRKITSKNDTSDGN